MTSDAPVEQYSNHPSSLHVSPPSRESDSYRDKMTPIRHRTVHDPRGQPWTFDETLQLIRATLQVFPFGVSAESGTIKEAWLPVVKLLNIQREGKGVNAHHLRARVLDLLKRHAAGLTIMTQATDYSTGKADELCRLLEDLQNMVREHRSNAMQLQSPDGPFAHATGDTPTQPRQRRPIHREFDEEDEEEEEEMADERTLSARKRLRDEAPSSDHSPDDSASEGGDEGHLTHHQEQQALVRSSKRQARASRKLMSPTTEQKEEKASHRGSSQHHFHSYAATIQLVETVIDINPFGAASGKISEGWRRVAAILHGRGWHGTNNPDSLRGRMVHLLNQHHKGRLLLRLAPDYTTENLEQLRQLMSQLQQKIDQNGGSRHHKDEDDSHQLQRTSSKHRRILPAPSSHTPAHQPPIDSHQQQSVAATVSSDETEEDDEDSDEDSIVQQINNGAASEKNNEKHTDKTALPVTRHSQIHLSSGPVVTDTLEWYSKLIHVLCQHERMDLHQESASHWKEIASAMVERGCLRLHWRYYFTVIRDLLSLPNSSALYAYLSDLQGGEDVRLVWQTVQAIDNVRKKHLNAQGSSAEEMAVEMSDLDSVMSDDEKETMSKVTEASLRDRYLQSKIDLLQAKRRLLVLQCQESKERRTLEQRYQEERLAELRKRHSVYHDAAACIVKVQQLLQIWTERSDHFFQLNNTQ